MHREIPEIMKSETQKLYMIEQKLEDALKALEGLAQNPELQRAFADHRQETLGHIRRLEQICSSRGWNPVGIPSQIIVTMLKESLEDFNGAPSSHTNDILLIAAAQKSEHLEIASYGALKTLFEQEGDSQSAQLLQQTLDEEKRADEKLSSIATSSASRAASVH